MTVVEGIIFGLICHIVADLFYQDHFMAENKSRLFYREEGEWKEYKSDGKFNSEFIPAVPHLAGWVHAIINGMFAVIIFSPLVALALAVVHLVIDTRIPLQYWRHYTGQLNDPEHPIFPVFAFIQDQALHLLCIAFASWLQFSHLI